MLYDKLPNVGDICSSGFDLRVDCAQAVSAVEIAAGSGASGLTSAAKLRDFFIAAANAADKAAGGSGSAVIASGYVVLTANQAVVTDGDPVVVDDNVGTPNAKSPGVASVSAGALQKVTLAA